MLELLAISGSLRQASSNSALLDAAATVVPEGVRMRRWHGLGGLPLFNPDEEGSPPPVAQAFRDAVLAADGVVLSSPEYAHGIAGAFKNGLDWLVGSPELMGKPVALLNASGRAHHAYDALTEIITTMGWTVVAPASLCVPISSQESDPAALLEKPEVAGELRRAMAQLASAIAQLRVETAP